MAEHVTQIAMLVRQIQRLVTINIERLRPGQE